jgi:hypothetical protein
MLINEVLANGTGMAHSLALKHAFAIKVVTLSVAALALPVLAQAQASSGSALTLEERSTVETIPLQSMGQQALSNTVIEGGLAPSASGRPPPPSPTSENFSPFTDPLLLNIGENRTSANRFPLNFEIQYQHPKNIPGIEFGRSYNIAPQPPNRTYDYYQFNTIER